MTKRSRLTRLAPFLVALALSTSCGDEPGSGNDGDGAGTKATGPPATLVGRDWLSTAVSEDGADRALVSGSRIAMTFDASTVSAYAGCNHLSGRADWDGATLLVEAVGGTEMGCPPPLLKQDAWLTEVLLSGPTVDVEADTMTLTDGGTVLTFADEETVMPSAELRSTTWVLDGLGHGGGSDGTMSSVPAGVRSTLRIDGDRLGVRPGCNTGGGSVEVGPETLLIGPVMTTQMACLDSRAEVEKAVLTVLQGEVAYAIDGDLLTLTRGDQTLVYRAAG